MLSSRCPNRGAGTLSEPEATGALERLRREWDSLLRLSVTEGTVALADALAVTNNLRGYDAIHLASALLWQGAIGGTVTLATFDRELSGAAVKEGVAVLP